MLGFEPGSAGCKENALRFVLFLAPLFFVFVFSFTWRGSHLVVLKDYPWLCAQESLLEGSGNHVGCQELNQSPSCVGCMQGKPPYHCAILWPLLFFLFFLGGGKGGDWATPSNSWRCTQKVTPSTAQGTKKVSGTRLGSREVTEAPERQKPKPLPALPRGPVSCMEGLRW